MPLDNSFPPPSERPGLLFRLAALLTAAFVITVLCLIATVFADPRAPVNIWLNENATPILVFEVLGIVIFGAAAMALDQYRQPDSSGRTRSLDSPSSAASNPGESRIEPPLQPPEGGDSNIA